MTQNPRVFVLAALLAAMSVMPAGTESALVPGFSDEIVASGLTLPVAFTELPDGRILIAEKSGVVQLLKNGVLQATPFLDLRSRVNDYWDRGLLGMAVGSDFLTSGH